MPRAKLTGKGQTTIPFVVREHLGVQYGDEIDFVLAEDGSVALRSVKRDVRSLEGLLARPGRPSVPLEAMNDAIRKAAVNRYRRTGRPARRRPPTASRPSKHRP